MLARPLVGLAAVILIVLAQRLPDPEPGRRPGVPGTPGGGEGVTFIRIDQAPVAAAPPTPAVVPPPEPEPVTIEVPVRKLDD